MVKNHKRKKAYGDSSTLLTLITGWFSFQADAKSKEMVAIDADDQSDKQAVQNKPTET